MANQVNQLVFYSRMRSEKLIYIQRNDGIHYLLDTDSTSLTAELRISSIKIAFRGDSRDIRWRNILGLVGVIEWAT
jgi:hypothetical protein